MESKFLTKALKVRKILCLFEVLASIKSPVLDEGTWIVKVLWSIEKLRVLCIRKKECFEYKYVLYSKCSENKTFAIYR